MLSYKGIVEINHLFVLYLSLADQDKTVSCIELKTWALRSLCAYSKDCLEIVDPYILAEACLASRRQSSELSLAILKGTPSCRRGIEAVGCKALDKSHDSSSVHYSVARGHCLSLLVSICEVDKDISSKPWRVRLGYNLAECQQSIRSKHLLKTHHVCIYCCNPLQSGFNPKINGLFETWAQECVESGELKNCRLSTLCIVQYTLIKILSIKKAKGPLQTSLIV